MQGWTCIFPHKISKYKKYLWLSAIVVIVAVCVQPLWAGFACLKSPCMHGICIDDINSPHQCYCRNGFTGYSCQINWDECRTSPCLNGGTCIDGIASYNCSCPENFTGTLCEYDLSVCDEQFLCQNNGTCTNDPNSVNGTEFMCSCLPGFSGDHCEIDISICNTTESICQNGGKCLDGLGSKFVCECEPGWTGQLCQTDIDECESQPCQNGGICLNKVNDFSCACPFGYMGKTCETKLKICEENPCHNGAFCLEEDDKKTCYCVPDFHGVLCEEQYDECDPPPKCFNGGTCMDGVGQFTCSCPPDFFGPTCQCTLANVSEPECQGLNTTISSSSIMEMPSVFPQPTLTVSNPFSTLLLPDATQSLYASPEITLVTTFFQTEIYESSLSFDSPYDPGGAQTQALPPSISQVITIYPGESELFTTLVHPEQSSLVIIDTVSISITMKPSPSFLDPSTIPIQDSLSDLIPFSSPSLSSSLFSTAFQPEYSTHQVAFPSSGITSEDIMTVEVSSPEVSVTPTSVPGMLSTTALLFPPEEHNSSIISTLPSDSNIIISSIVELSPSISDMVIESSYPATILIPTADLTAAIPQRTTIDVDEYPSPTYSVGGGESSLAISNESALTIIEIPFSSPTLSSSVISIPTVSTAQLPQVSSSAAEALNSDESVGQSLSLLPPTLFTVAPTATTTLLLLSSASSSLVTPILVTPSQDIITDSSSAHIYSEFPYETSDLLTISEVIASATVTTGLFSTVAIAPTATFSISPPEASESLWTTTPATNLSDPCDNYCQNNAKCSSESILPICTCPFTFIGDRCEIPRKRFKTPSFSGNSFLMYKLPLETVNTVHISTQLATVVPEGIIMYTGSGSIYSLIFLQSGLVSLHFSCGFQSMHFVEMRTRVDNGYNFTLEFQMNMVIHGVNEFHCIGQLSVNQSYIMKGEQIVGRNGLQGNPIDAVHIGGVYTPDAEKNDELIAILPGFRGCMHKLMINQENKDMFEDALDGKDISECAAFGCIVNPCSHTSRCVSTDKYPFWECICSPGYQGIRCQIKVCTSNPCLNGATCTVPFTNNHHHSQGNTSNTDVSTQPPSEIRDPVNDKPICLCPLGFTGLMCQSAINITKPSFRPVYHDDYSAYIAYEPIPRFADWFQLKFHFVTTNMTQIAILMYIGNEWVNGALTAAQLENPLTMADRPELKNYYYFEQEKASDFFSITFLQGFVVLTWNLGSGTQRIVTPSRVDSRLNIHTLFAGRSGRHAWLKVDGMRNTSGKAPGPLYRLNVDTDLYVGGYEAFRFEGLPHDLPLHKGFHGCIFDLGFRVKNKLYLPKANTGRSVKNCYEEDC